jgi:hypothetical protein
MNLILLKGGYPPVVIGPEHRPAYIDSLQALQTVKDERPYQTFMWDRLEMSLDHYLEVLRRGLLLDPGASPAAPDRC